MQILPLIRLLAMQHFVGHFFGRDRAVRDQMVAKGWLAEGDGPDTVVTCAPPA